MYQCQSRNRGYRKPGSHTCIPQTHQQRSRRLQLTMFSDLCQRIPAHLRWIDDVLKFLPLNMDQIVLLEYVVTAHDVHAH